MADPLSKADQSGLSDLSVASIGLHLNHPTPVLDDNTEIHTSTISLATAFLTPNAARIDRETPSLLSNARSVDSYRAQATPGPSHIPRQAARTSGPAWTPSQDGSSSHSRSRTHFSRRSASPRSVKDANESVGSSSGTFDFSNASFSESFLRQAGENMLAGLAEAERPPISGPSSPRYRTSSSPTVTARPLNQQAVPRTPFTGKSLRTRMAEAGMLDSPTSSDGSSPARSPSAQMVDGSSTGSWSGSGSLDALGPQQERLASDSPEVQRYADQPLSSPLVVAGSPYQHGKARSVEMAQENYGDQSVGQSDWQEGLSMVPEESYVEDVSRLASLSAFQKEDPQKSVDVAATPSTFMLQFGGEDAAVEASQSLVHGPDSASNTEGPGVVLCSSPSPPEVTSDLIQRTQPQSPSQCLASIVQPSTTPRKVTDSLLTSTSPKNVSPSPSRAVAASPRPLGTPRSFARLCRNTPARSSPLSRVINFTPSSTGSSPQWQSLDSRDELDAHSTSSPNWASPSSRMVATASPSVKFHTPLRQDLEPLDSIAPVVSNEGNSDQRSTREEDSSPTSGLSHDSGERQTPFAHRTPKDAWEPASATTPPQFWSPADSAASRGTPTFQGFVSAPTTPLPGRSAAEESVAALSEIQPASGVSSFASPSSQHLASVLNTPAQADGLKHHVKNEADLSPAGTSFATSASRRYSSASRNSTLPPSQHGALLGTPDDVVSSAFDASLATPASQRLVSAFSLPMDVASSVKSPSAVPAGPVAAQHGAVASLQCGSPSAAKQCPKDEAETSAKVTAENSLRSSSSCSSSSEKKQSGELSTSSTSHTAWDDDRKDVDRDLALDSPSAARFSRLQVSRIPPPGSTPSASSVPVLGWVSNAIDSLTHLSDSRVARLLAQLSASTGCIEDLEAALEAKERREATLNGELEDVRFELGQLQGQYEELVQETEDREKKTRVLIRELKERIEARSAKDRDCEVEGLRRALEEERRLRDMERRDHEVRLQMLNPVSSPTASAQDPYSATPTEIEAAKEQLRITLEKDFAIRQSMETRELKARIAELDSKLASTTAKVNFSPDGEEKSELRKQLEEVEAELDRRFEELSDVREELGTMGKSKEEAEDRIAALENELSEAREQRRDQRDGDRVEQLMEKVETLREQLIEREEQVERVEETLSLTQSQLEAVLAERDTLAHRLSLAEQEGPAQALASQVEVSALRGRIVSLESHILLLEAQLRTHHSPASSPSKVVQASSDIPSTERTERQSQLEKELANLNLELVRLTKANEALQEDNIHFSIALSAKQLELGMVKRNARFALKNANAQVKEDASRHIGLPLSKSVQTCAQPAKENVEAQKVENRVWPSVPKGEIGGGEDKENQALPRNEVNSARANARALLAQRRALGQMRDGGRQDEKRQRLALLA